MAIIYFFIGAIFGIPSLFILSRYFKNQSIITSITVVIVIFGMLIAKFYAVPFYRSVTFEYFSKRDNPRLKSIASHYPTEYAAYIKNVKIFICRNDNSNQEILYQIAFLNTLFSKVLPTATNESIYNYYTNELKLYNALFQVDPKLVVFMEFPNKFNHKPDPGLLIGIAGTDLIKQLIQTKEDVILSEIQTPQHALTSSERANAIASINQIISTLSDKYGQTNVTNTMLDISNTETDMNTAALIIINFYQEVLDRGIDRSGDIFEYLNTPQ